MGARTPLFLACAITLSAPAWAQPDGPAPPGASKAETKKAPPAQSKPPAVEPPIDRVLIRWYAPETGGVARPRFVFERELAFEARLESFADPDPEPGAFRERHVRAALDRRIAETLLANLPITPPPTAKEIWARMAAARAMLEQRVRGKEKLEEAAAAEGIGPSEIEAMIGRQARASLYVDRMIAPMLEPSELELRELHTSGATPFTDEPFEKIAPALSRLVIGQRLGQAVEAYYQNARSRVVIAYVRTPR
jgi:hypothetical protein